MENTAMPSYTASLDAIVLAGTDSNPSRMIEGQNKAFLEVGGQALVRRVVEKLLSASEIGEIFVVGPEDRLQKALSGLPDRVNIVKQAGQMLSNAWAAINASEARHREHSGSDDPLRPLLFISSDLPLISAVAVDDFVSRCAHQERNSGIQYSLFVGVAEEASLKQFYPGDSKEGIHRPYVNFSDCRVRLANIYVSRPRTLSNNQFLETGFTHRKAEKLKNVISLVGKFLGQAGGWQAAWITLKLQLTLAASKHNGRVFQYLRKNNKRERIEQACGAVLGGTVRIVLTPYGSLSLDVDNEEDYQVLSQHFDNWSRIGPVEPEV
jgi:GTP:adenosylcobinamide-phosphate guanylyltransferase